VDFLNVGKKTLMIKKPNKVLAFIGDGEGKTSAAIGHAIRAAGHNKKVAIIQFLKGIDKCGEYLYLTEKNSKIEIHLSGERFFLRSEAEKYKHLEKAKEGLALAENLLLSGRYFLIVLDEIFDIISYDLISTNDVEKLLDVTLNEKCQTNLILTGRKLPSELSKKIDLITQMRKVKHYYDLGEKGIEGLDW